MFDVSYEKFLGSHMFFFKNVMIAVGKRWQCKFIDWKYDEVMRKACKWSLYVGPVEIRLYQKDSENV